MKLLRQIARIIKRIVSSFSDTRENDVRVICENGRFTVYCPNIFSRNPLYEGYSKDALECILKYDLELGIITKKTFRRIKEKHLLQNLSIHSKIFLE